MRLLRADCDSVECGRRTKLPGQFTPPRPNLQIPRIAMPSEARKTDGRNRPGPRETVKRGAASPCNHVQNGNLRWVAGKTPEGSLSTLQPCLQLGKGLNYGWNPSWGSNRRGCHS